MLNIKFKPKFPSHREQNIIHAGFHAHAMQSGAPAYHQQELTWIGYDQSDQLKAVLTAVLTWDWIYIDELWVDESVRRQGYGKLLMNKVESFAGAEKVSGLWLWTQSWQASEFYKNLGYFEFTRFPNFPKGHSRIGYRKNINTP